MTSPYLEQPFVPLGVALPRMLENIKAESSARTWTPQMSSASGALN
jgi:hypothetical protein